MTNDEDDRDVGILGRLLCRLGWHAYQLVDVKLSFGSGGNVEIHQCQRCGQQRTRSG